MRMYVSSSEEKIHVVFFNLYIKQITHRALSFRSLDDGSIKLRDNGSGNNI